MFLRGDDVVFRRAGTPQRRCATTSLQRFVACNESANKRRLLCLNLIICG